MAKKFEINLTPQNDEWLNLIPNTTQNMDIIVNKVLEIAINEGILLEVISQSLTLADLAKFRASYTKLQSKRAEYMNELDVKPQHVERKKVVQTQTIESEQETVDASNYEAPVARPAAKKPEKKMSHGFSEDSF